MEISSLYEIFLKHPVVTSDSRAISDGCIFFGLKGPNFNGNTFALEALERGAAYAVVEDTSLLKHPNCMVVPNSLETLQALGSYHRNHSKATIISLTGSNGKTTTKELIYRVLSQKYKTIATQGNLNNHIGVPLSLLRIEKSTEFAIIEMGANHQKEIAALCEIAQPDFGCITNFGKAHMEGFGGVAGIIKGKSELYDYLIQQQKTILYNDQDPIQVEKTKHYKNRISFGANEDSSFKTNFINTKQATVSFAYEGMEIHTQLYGDYNTQNCMIAAAIGSHYGVALSDIKKAIESYRPANNRSEIKAIGKHHIILDAYNANPSSMTAALQHFSKLQTELPKLAILGDMFELGETAVAEHQEVIKLLENSGLERVILVGDLFGATQHSFEHYSNFENLKKASPKIAPSNILIKGSRGMALERILPLLESE
ncbi:MAG: UDP-N-acetylmuramoyl-tripeptide--D-alanyl-D-alanine ligase [Flavobacteriaceae bacterium]|nr:UDP-N-acetylmuramoyl-tripeptide--D-alanyl-D-alanine ligase [Flavobacteriaceae bacterium]MCI5088547.1 UDP-N-acetylmuramoyl-tripeptide--D-alanyl-D-alanine ligase [Flavobacteriaceae bacterium]CAI8205114.1 MAG: UDP-N-acetylmuramoyl-tripeptide--D-alanyl-D-alanine ligase [SAR116 cluster bacterium]